MKAILQAFLDRDSLRIKTSPSSNKQGLSVLQLLSALFIFNSTLFPEQTLTESEISHLLHRDPYQLNWITDCFCSFLPLSKSPALWVPSYQHYSRFLFNSSFIRGVHMWPQQNIPTAHNMYFLWYPFHSVVNTVSFRYSLCCYIFQRRYKVSYKIKLLAMIALSIVHSPSRILIHNAILFSSVMFSTTKLIL